jgi:S-adenosylmethionine:tRNA ribosyltransferase-isomerase
VFAQQGTAPLPPYIKHTPLTREQLLTEYQSVFAKDPGSIAAPTASLHFTPELLASLQDRGIALAYTTLHVHLGTFAPLTEEQWQTGRLHQEEYHIDPQTIAVLEQAKRDGRPIIAVGTTVVRTLESATDDAGVITRSEADTSLFIREGYTFRMVSGLITNFHVPRSSLLMLVAALTGRETLLSLYKEAIEKRFRLFSFGDAMLIL